MTERNDLPLPDYDHLQVGSLTSRIRTLGEDDLQTLITYERSHANRIQVVAAMENRMSSLKAGAQPSGGNPAASTPESTPESAPSPDGGSKASEATSGPPVNPPPHGDPTTPAQPR